MICYKCMREYSGSYCRHCGFNPETYEPMPTALMPMTVLNGKYIIGAVLGKGGFGITYISYDNLNYRKVAVKEFYPSSVAYRDSNQTTEVSVPSNMKQIYENGVKKFYNEAVTLSKLQNIPAIVKIYDFFYENNTAYIVMEFIDGTAVDRIVLNQGGLDVDITLTIYYPIIQALKTVHDAGILHRDISPSNVMLDERYMSHLIDFGSSRAYSHEMSTDLTVILKKGFAPIEQYSRKGKHGPAEDVYAICASMYYTMTGKVPPAAPDRRVFDTLQPIHNFYIEIPENIEKVIMKGLSVQPEDRYPDMKALSKAIDAAVSGEQEKSTEKHDISKDKHESIDKKSKDKKSNKYDNHVRITPQIILLAASGTLLLILLIILILIL